jgi:hypothetical protein
MRRRLLWVLLGSIAVNAALGIYALAAPGFGELQRHVLLTSVCVTAGGIVALACLPAWERRRLWPVPLVSVGAAVLGLAFAVVLVWGEPSGGWRAAEKAMGTLFILGGAGVLASLLALAGLAPRFRWVLAVTLGLVGLLALVWIGAMWADWEPSPLAQRLIGVAAVLMAAFVVAVPILHRVSAQVAPGEARAAVRFCPACATPVAAGAGDEVTCARCGAVFRVRYSKRPAARPAVETVPPGGTRAACSGQA